MMQDLDVRLEEVEFIVLDVETTGLGDEDRVIEFACLGLKNGRETVRFQSLVNPGIPIPPQASEVSGITDEMVRDAPPFAGIAPKLEEILDGATPVAHNAFFDMRFLSNEWKRLGRSWWKGKAVDTLLLARNVIRAPEYGLGALQRRLSLPHEPTHRAMSDVEATADLFLYLLERLEPKPQTLADLLKAQEPQPASAAQALDEGYEKAIVEALSASMERHEAVTITYRGRAATLQYVLEPLEFVHNGPLYYLRAIYLEEGGLRTFRLDRIESVEPALAGTGQEEWNSDTDGGDQREG